MNNRLMNFLKILVSICVLVVVFAGGYRFASKNGRIVGGNQDFATLQQVYNILSNDFYFGVDSEEYRQKLVDDAIRGMVEGTGDIHTSYFSSEEMSEFVVSLTANFVGIGVTYNAQTDYLLVATVIPNSPAQAAGLQSGDLIYSVNGVELTTKTIDDVQDMIKGEAGTKVTIGIIRDNKYFDVELTRAAVYNTIETKMINENTGLLELSSFSDTTGKELKSHLEFLKQSGAENLIIDVRDNGGGYKNTLDTICGYFMEDNAIIMKLYNRKGEVIVDKVTAKRRNGNDIYKYNKIIILTNGSSASCSEVFTLAMKENCNAVTVGETTYGKGISQITVSFADSSTLKYTDERWESGNGVYIGNVGIVPDYEVVMSRTFLSGLPLCKDEVLKYDSVDTYNILLQLKLQFLGYEIDRTDGYYSVATRNAVMKLQSEHGIQVTGDVDYRTSQIINSEVTKKYYNNPTKYDTQLIRAISLTEE